MEKVRIKYRNMENAFGIGKNTFIKRFLNKNDFNKEAECHLYNFSESVEVV